MKRIPTVLVALTFLFLASCSKSDTTSTPTGTTSLFTLYGSSADDIVVVDTNYRHVLHQGEIYSYTILTRIGSSASISIQNSVSEGWLANALLSYPSDGAPVILQIQGNKPAVFGSTEYISH